MATPHLFLSSNGQLPLPQYPVDVRHQLPIVGRVHFLIVGSHPGLDSEQEDFQIPLLLKPVGNRIWDTDIEVSTDRRFAAVNMKTLTSRILKNKAHIL